MKTLQIKHVDAFTRKRWCGNPAGVVLDARTLTDGDMQAIAKEMNLSETAFLQPSSKKGADIHIRWFTPTEEVDLCGHATIASFHALAEAGLYGMQKEGRYRFTVDTRSGLLGIVVDKTSSGDMVEFELPRPDFRPMASLPEGIIQAVGLSSDDIPAHLPPVQDAYTYIPVRSIDTLHRIDPDGKTLGAELRRMNTGGLCLFTRETVDPASAVHSRFFAPGLGVDEDPVTGSANGPLGVYLETYVRPQDPTVPSEDLADGRREYIGEQGDVLGRPGRVLVRVATEGGEVRRVWIAGNAVTIMDSMIRFQDED